MPESLLSFGAAALRAPPQGAACTVPPRKDAQLHPKAPGFPWQLPEHPGCKCGAGRGAQQLGITPRDLSTFPSLPRAIRGSPLGGGGVALPGAGSAFGHGAVLAGVSVCSSGVPRGFGCLPSGLFKRARTRAWLDEKKKRFLRARLPSPSRLGS